MASAGASSGLGANIMDENNESTNPWELFTKLGIETQVERGKTIEIRPTQALSDQGTSYFLGAS